MPWLRSTVSYLISQGCLKLSRLAYVLVQERKLAHGLPPQYQTGSPSMAGTCRVWTGRYANGQRWLSFRRGTISVVISSNSLSTRQLVGHLG